ncbi:MAG: SAM-dependent chlorinase/fluorinase, partial [Chloroflexota bacterium]
IPPQDVRAGAFALLNAAPYFPPGTVHVAVVDPGVGSARRPLALQLDTHFFVGPDNGLFNFPMGAFPIDPSAFAVVHLTNRKFWRRDVSHTFHGRDIFAPVAAHLSLGVPLAELGDVIARNATDVRRVLAATFALPSPKDTRDGAVGEVIHIDRFGNCITNIRAWRVADGQPVIAIAGRRIVGVRQTYAEVERGELLALIGSSGYLEIAVREGNAAQTLGVNVGDEVRVVN